MKPLGLHFGPRFLLYLAGILALAWLISVAVGQEARIPVITIAGHTLTNATLRVLNSTNGMVSAGTIAVKVKLADLPEPWRSQYHDPKKIAVEEQAQRDLAAAEAKLHAEWLEKKKQQPPPQQSAAWFESEWVTLAKPKAVTAERGMDISGTLKSRAEKRTLRSLSIRFGIYDAAGNKVGTASDYIAELAAGETWKYEASSFARGGRSYKLESITCRDGRLD